MSALPKDKISQKLGLHFIVELSKQEDSVLKYLPVVIFVLFTVTLVAVFLKVLQMVNKVEKLQ